MNSPALTIKTLNHNFGSLKALDNVDITLNEGDYAILLGLNGAGKSNWFN